MHDTDRRRLLLAAIVTLIAVPAFLLFNRGGDDDTGDSAQAAETNGTTASAGNVINPVPGQEPTGSGNVINPLPEQQQVVPTDAPAATQSQLPPIEAPDDAPIFMNGPVAMEEDAVAEVAVPAEPAAPVLLIDASYSSSLPGTRTCRVWDVESGRTVRVTNLDNGRSITCVTALPPRTQRDDLLMHTSAFEQLADLTDAPIAVEVRQ